MVKKLIFRPATEGSVNVLISKTIPSMIPAHANRPPRSKRRTVPNVGSNPAIAILRYFLFVSVISKSWKGVFEKAYHFNHQYSKQTLLSVYDCLVSRRL